MTRLLYGLLAIVAAAAGMLSFAALRDLAELCGFSRSLAWLLPVVVDAGAAAGSLVWLGGHADIRARRFARALALVLLGSSVAANALSHGLAAYGARPHWGVVVLVSGVAPAVLGAVVHLAALAARGEDSGPANLQHERAGEQTVEDSPAPGDEPPAVALHLAPEPAGREDRAAVLIAAGAGRRKLARELGISEHEARELLAARREGVS